MSSAKIEIFWDDLTPEKQQEFLNLFGENGNFDVFPLAVLEYEMEEDQEIAQGMKLS